MAEYTESYAVIGGEGFVGQALVQKLLTLHPSSAVASLGLTQRTFTPGYRFFRADITSTESISSALKLCGATTVFHTASPHLSAGVEVCESVNVSGTKAVVQACWDNGVKKLVYTSSVTVVFEGEDLINADERMPVSERQRDPYVATKIKGEKIVLDANGVDGLLTCSLRIGGIFGPGDRQAIPGMLKVLQNRQTSFQIGFNENLFDWIYIDNVIHAHVLAAARLSSPPISIESFQTQLPPVNSTILPRTLPTSRFPDVSLRPSSATDQPLPSHRHRFDQFYRLSPSSPSLSVAGESFLITNGEPVPAWTFVRAIWFAYNGHVPPFVLPLPKSIGMMIAGLTEAWGWLVGLPKGDEGLTRDRVKFVVCHLYFSIEKARRVLGYEPLVSLQEGIQRTAEWVRKDEAASSEKSSKS